MSDFSEHLEDSVEEKNHKSAESSTPPRQRTRNPRQDSSDLEVLEVPKHLLSRVLYTNPVCFLSARSHRTGARSVMTISWLTPTDNHGGLFLSMNEKRHTARFVREAVDNPAGISLCLSVATHSQTETLLNVGGCSGADGDKIDRLQLPVCRPGAWEDEIPRLSEDHDGSVKNDEEVMDREDNQKSSVGEATNVDTDRRGQNQVGHTKARAPTRLSGAKQIEKENIEALRAGAVAIGGATAAHILFKVVGYDVHDGHLWLRCRTLAAWVRAQYWDGSALKPKRQGAAGRGATSEVGTAAGEDRGQLPPPTLTFFGSKHFGSTIGCETEVEDGMREVREMFS